MHPGILLIQPASFFRPYICFLLPSKFTRIHYERGFWVEFLHLSSQAFPGVRVAELNNVISQGMNRKKKHEVGSIYSPLFPWNILILLKVVFP